MILKTFRLLHFGLAALVSIAHGITVEGEHPTVTIKAAVDPTIKAAVEGQMNEVLKTSFDKTLADTRAKLSVYNEQKKLAQGFGNANAYSMNSATLQGFQNYDLF